MKTTIKAKTYKAIYRLLDRVSPISGDCGQLCGSACCTCEGDSLSDNSEDFNMGIYLLPGEEKIFNKNEPWLKWTVENAEDYDFPHSWHGKIYFVRCKTPPHCPREMRPLQCRFYPLFPYLSPEGNLSLILSPLNLPYECPLIRDKMALEPSFIQATFTVWKRLIQDPYIRDLVEMDSQGIRKAGSDLHVVI